MTEEWGVGKVQICVPSLLNDLLLYNCQFKGDKTKYLNTFWLFCYRFTHTKVPGASSRSVGTAAATRLEPQPLMEPSLSWTSGNEETQRNRQINNSFETSNSLKNNSNRNNSYRSGSSSCYINSNSILCFTSYSSLRWCFPASAFTITPKIVERSSTVFWQYFANTGSTNMDEKIKIPPHLEVNT